MISHLKLKILLMVKALPQFCAAFGINHIEFFGKISSQSIFNGT
jgi:hypothetical protein